MVPGLLKDSQAAWKGSCGALHSLLDQVAQPQSLAGLTDFGTGTDADLCLRASRNFRRFAIALGAFAIVPPLVVAAFVIAVDPYYVFGLPSWSGFNAVRPYYERHVLVAKPYQVRRLRPAAVALGSSRVEVGIDPRHGGWIDRAVFNFALP